MWTLEAFYHSKYLEMIHESLREVLPMAVLFESDVYGNIVGEGKYEDRRARRRLFSEDNSGSCGTLNNRDLGADERPCKRTDRQAALWISALWDKQRQRTGDPVRLTGLYKCRSQMSACIIPISIPSYPQAGIIGYLYGGQFFADMGGSGVPQSYDDYVWTVFKDEQTAAAEPLRDTGEGLLFIHPGFGYDGDLDPGRVLATIKNGVGVGFSVPERFMAEWQNDTQKLLIDGNTVQLTIGVLQHVASELFLRYDADEMTKKQKVLRVLQHAVELGTARTDKTCYIARLNSAVMLEEIGEYKEAELDFRRAMEAAAEKDDHAAIDYAARRVNDLRKDVGQQRSAADRPLVSALVDLYDLFSRPQTQLEPPEPDRLFGEMARNLEIMDSVVCRSRGLSTGSPNALLALQRWNSYTPLIRLRPGPQREGPLGAIQSTGMGGGMFLLWEGKGIVIDPGTDFLTQFLSLGYSVADIDCVLCSHAHIDHTGDLEPLLTLLYQHNKMTNDAHGVRLVMNPGTAKKYSGWFDLDESYIYDHVTLSPYSGPNWFSVCSDVQILPTHAFHNEIVSKKYPIGFLLRLTDSHGAEFLAWYTGDTGFYRQDRCSIAPRDVWTPVSDAIGFGDEAPPIDLLIANIGSIDPEEIAFARAGLRPEEYASCFYDHHLGILGIVKLIGLSQPRLTILTEFGEEFASFRRDVADIVRRNTGCGVIAADTGLRVRFPEERDLPFRVRCVRPDGEYDSEQLDRTIFYTPAESVSEMYSTADGGLRYHSKEIFLKTKVLHDVAKRSLTEEAGDDRLDREPRRATSLAGWQSSEERVRSSNLSDDSPLLTLDVGLHDSSGVGARAPMYPAVLDSRATTVAGGDALSSDAWQGVVRMARDSGAQSMRLRSDGDPLRLQIAWDILEAAHEAGIWSVVLTTGEVLGDDSVCRDALSFGAEEALEKLGALRVSLMLRWDALSREAEEQIVRPPGPNHFLCRSRALERLIRSEFNQCSSELPEGATTKLGVRCVVAPPNLSDLEEIYKLRIYSNIFPAIEPGLYSDALSADHRIALCQRIYELNARHGMPFSGASVFFGTEPCTRLPNGLYVDPVGDVYPCPGLTEPGDRLGNVRDSGVGLAAMINESPYRQGWRTNGEQPYGGSPYAGTVYHGCRCYERAGVLPDGWEADVNARVISLYDRDNLHDLVSTHLR